MNFFKIFTICFLVFLSFSSFFVNNALADTTASLIPITDGGEDSSIWNNTGGSACDTTDCYVEVDDTAGSSCSSSDGDASYIESNNGITGQTFDINESTIPDGYLISQIDITTCYKKAGGGTSTFQTRYCNDGSCVSSGTNIVPGVIYEETTQSIPVNFYKSASSDIEVGVINTEADATVKISQIKTVITYSPPDLTAPSAVSDLVISGATQTTIDLDWTAQGDDGSSGTATTYDIRYSVSNITNDTDFNNATQVVGEPSPSIAGTAESMTVTGLSSDTTYYFAIKTSDEVPNTSPLSNVPSGTTTIVPDTTPPSAVSDLSTSSVGATTIDLDWTAPGDDGSIGTATVYDVRYSMTNITSGNWAAAVQATGEPSPSVAGTIETMTVTGLSTDVLYYFAITTSDEVPNTSDLSNIVSDSTTSVPDSTPPADISDFSASNPTTSSVDLDWTASGDDGSSGTATTYDIRYSTATINDSNWASAIQVAGEPNPSFVGSSESMTITGLSSGTTYYFAIKTSDEIPNTSGLSNVTSETTNSEGTIIIPSGGGGGGISPTRISFSGRAFRGSKIEVLIKSDINPIYKNIPVSTYRMSEDGEFYIDYLALLVGKYFLALKAVDKSGQETGFLTFSVDFSSQKDLIVEDILFPPTVIFEEAFSIKTKNAFEVSGHSSPDSKVEIKINDIIKEKVIADGFGFYSAIINLEDLGFGIHYIKTRQMLEDSISSFSVSRAFKIYESEIFKYDFNNDGVINVSDWSIFLFRWGSEDVELQGKIDLNKDNKVNIEDFSIFLKQMRPRSII